MARIPGCGAKLAELYGEFQATGEIQEVRAAEADPTLATLELFNSIWGVGAATARDLFNKGCRDLDDIIEHYWNDLSRVQQIGLKYRDDFRVPIPRAESERITQAVLEHVNRVCLDSNGQAGGWEATIVGSYRRGRPTSGDVDIVISHRDIEATKHCVGPLVASLEKSGLITHTLTMSHANSERGQVPVAWKGNTRAGSGFDTLDKALVVWQEPSEESPNPNPHRRVDIIVSPWRTVGCAVLGWSGGTTFQRDLRAYCARERRLKFDSSGVRSRVDGTWMDLEGPEWVGVATGGEEQQSSAMGKASGKGKGKAPNRGIAPDMVSAEKRVFEGLGLVYREPWERCTE